MQIEILGVQYPAEYTVGAQKRIASLFGGTGAKMMESAFSGDPHEINERTITLSCALIEAGIAREKAMCKMEERKYEGPESAPDMSILLQTLRPKEVKRMFDAALETIKEGNKTEMEVQEVQEKGKKNEERSG